MSARKQTLEEATAEFKESFLKLIDDTVSPMAIDAIVDLFRYHAKRMGGTAPRQPRKINQRKTVVGYHIFMSEKMHSEEILKFNSKERMAEIAKLWRSLSPHEAEEYNEKARVKNVEILSKLEEEGQDKTQKVDNKKRVKKVHKYNIFVSEMMKTDEIMSLPKESKMIQIAAIWKEMTDEEKSQYETKARIKNEEAEKVTADS